MAEHVDARRLGVYYTPDQLAATMTRWALADGARRVLDPSCGDGRFVRAAACELANVAGARITGVDIDQNAVRALREERLPGVQLEVRSFFAATPSACWDAPFSAVIGNPPYVRHHWLDSSVREQARERAREAGVRLPNLADLWAYFVLHAAQHVALDGRLALVLPVAAAHADYAGPVWSFLRRSFGRVELILLQDRAFEHAREQPVILLASHRGGSAETLETAVASTITELAARLTRPAAERTSDHEPPDGVAKWKWDLLPAATRQAWTELSGTLPVRRLGCCAHVRIGVVTGANAVFVRRAGDPLLSLAGVESRPVVSSSRLLSMAVWRRADDCATGDMRGGGRLLLIDRASTPSGPLLELLTDAENENVHKRHHCSLREPWWALTDVAAPDAFLGYMGASPHHIVQNASGSLCTNAVHRVSWKRGNLRGAAVSSWSSLYRLSAELYGRHYGGGVLKLEPSAAKRLPILPAATVGDALEEIDSEARTTRGTAAVALADRRIAAALGATAADLRRLRKGAELLADARRVPR